MANSETSCWTVIKAAAAGNPCDREQFARLYWSIVRRYLADRWRSSPMVAEIDDATQDVFVECFKQDGVLDCAARDRGFRPFLYGVVRNVALRFEGERRRHARGRVGDAGALEGIADTEEELSRAFDRNWARQLLREAARAQEHEARKLGPAACRRVEILRLRFQEGAVIREIAARWRVDAGDLHHEYARAREEFKAALMQVVAYHRPGSRAEIEQECAQLLEILA
jgi:RNA polymerase sigma factor (sigma-70 family)